MKLKFVFLFIFIDLSHQKSIDIGEHEVDRPEKLAKVEVVSFRFAGLARLGKLGPKLTKSTGTAWKSAGKFSRSSAKRIGTSVKQVPQRVRRRNSQIARKNVKRRPQRRKNPRNRRRNFDNPLSDVVSDGLFHSLNIGNVLEKSQITAPVGKWLKQSRKKFQF